MNVLLVLVVLALAARSGHCKKDKDKGGQIIILGGQGTNGCGHGGCGGGGHYPFPVPVHMPQYHQAPQPQYHHPPQPQIIVLPVAVGMNHYHQQQQQYPQPIINFGQGHHQQVSRKSMGYHQQTGGYGDWGANEWNYW